MFDNNHLIAVIDNTLIIAFRVDFCQSNIAVNQQFKVRFCAEAAQF